MLSQRHRYCQSCRDSRWGKAGDTGRKTAAAVLRQLREQGRDPGHGGEAARIRGQKNAAHQAAVREWNDQNADTHDPSVFASEIAPLLRDFPVRALVDATGLSAHYCSLIRLGKRIPHPRHWKALAALRTADTA